MMQCRFVVLSSRYDIYCASKCTDMPYISLDSQWKMLSYNINHIIVDEVFLLEKRKSEKLLFNLYFFN